MQFVEQELDEIEFKAIEIDRITETNLFLHNSFDHEKTNQRV
jgi:hypothetical protein